MGLLKRKKKGEGDNPYLGLRNLMLNLKPKDINIELDADNQVYASIVDMSIRDNYATLVCVIDGTVSLYFSNGGGRLGLGGQENIRDNAIKLLLGAGEVVEGLKKTDNFDLPKDDKNKAYFLTRNGAFVEEFKYSEEDYNTYEEHTRFIMYLIEKVKTSISESGDLAKT